MPIMRRGRRALFMAVAPKEKKKRRKNVAYVRWSERSAVYIYDDLNGGITCCGCLLHPDGHSVNTFNHETMIKHVRQHIGAGHKVPDHVIPELEKRKNYATA